MRNGPYELIIPPPEYPGKRYRGRYAYEHRVNWWRANGKNPDDFPSSLIHHDNDQKRDNDPPNLILLSRAAHTSIHAKPAVLRSHICLNCGVTFEREAWKTPKFCSRQCIGLYGHYRRSKTTSGR